jgi:hypothetical protein
MNPYMCEFGVSGCGSNSNEVTAWICTKCCNVLPHLEWRQREQVLEGLLS